MNPYDVPDRPIPSWVDNYDDKPRICPECGREIHETIYVKYSTIIGCENCMKVFDISDIDADRYFDDGEDKRF